MGNTIIGAQTLDALVMVEEKHGQMGVQLRRMITA